MLGDVVGPGLTTTAAVDAETALRKPFGSAEQNLYNFAYTLYNLKYLKATNQLRSEILKANLEFMNSCKLLFLSCFYFLKLIIIMSHSFPQQISPSSVGLFI